MESSDGISGPVIAGLAIGIAFLTILSLTDYAFDARGHFPALIEVIRYPLSEVAINKATIEGRTVSEFGMTTGPPLCIAKFSEQELSSGMHLLNGILLNADRNNGEEVMHRLTPEEFISLAKELCVNELWAAQNEGKNIQWYPGWISVEDANKKYWYSVHIYWNWTYESRFKPIDKNFDGIFPEVDRLKVYIFASNETFFEPDLLQEIRMHVVDFEVTDESNFKFRPSIQGITNSDGYLVIPGGVDIYIDSAFVKPDGSQVTVQDFPTSTEFTNGFHQGQLGVYYDYEYTGTPAIWFAVDSQLYAEKVDSHLDEIRGLIQEHISQCEEFRKTLTPHEEGAPCP